MAGDFNARVGKALNKKEERIIRETSVQVHFSGAVESIFRLQNIDLNIDPTAQTLELNNLI